jgi:choline dehydrogenase
MPLKRRGSQSGQGYSEDLNGYKPEGIARLDATRKNGRRCSAAIAHLKPALARGNITLLTRAQVLKIDINGHSVSGVTFQHKGKIHSVEANKEVILSGGAINSPHLLMLSGIGPSEHLKEHGIDVHLSIFQVLAKTYKTIRASYFNTHAKKVFLFTRSISFIVN